MTIIRVRTAGVARRLLGPLLFVLPFVGLLAFFREVDPYHTAFSISGARVAAYNLCRALLVVYLFCTLEWTGSVFLRRIDAVAWAKLAPAEKLGLGFFAATGLWHIMLLGLGYLGLYRWLVAVALTVPIVALSFGHLRDVAVEACGDAGQAFRAASMPQRVLWLVLAAIGLATGIALFLVKGLYPAGGHDYYTHYFPYYRAVIEQGSLWPNSVWYHYYYSKGNGLTFLAMLLSDPLAPQLVTFCFFAAAALVLWQLLRRIAPETLWPFVGVTLFLGIYIYTPGVGEFLANGGWGDFEKSHELTVALMVAVLWTVSTALLAAGRSRLMWGSAAASVIVAVVIIEITFAVYLGLLFVFLGAFFAIRRKGPEVLGCLALATVAGSVLVALLLLNYATTGLPDDQAILFFWPWVDIEKLYRWGSLLLAIIVHWTLTGLVADAVPLDAGVFRFLALSLHLELLYPLLAIGLASAAFAGAFGRVHLDGKIPALVVAAATTAFLVIAIAGGRSEPISFYRYSSFMVPVVIALGAVFASVLSLRTLGPATRMIAASMLPLAVLVCCGYTAASAYPPGHFSIILSNAWRFAHGRFSIDQAYTDQTAWPGRLPWGAIYPGARGAYRVVGPHQVIWSFHVHSYCMLPDCEIWIDPAFVATRDLDRVLFGSPDEAKQILQKAGINYFLFSRELPLTDYLVGAPLFAPDNIARYLGLRWTDGKTALLTWLGPDTTPLDQDWLAAYRRAVQSSPAVQSFPWKAMEKIFAKLRKTPHPWRSFPLPWEHNHPY